MNTPPLPFTDQQISDIIKLKATVSTAIVPYIQDEIVPLLPVDYIIAGGLFPSLYHRVDVKDIDVFVLNHGNVFNMIHEKLVPLATLGEQNITSQSGHITFNSSQKDRRYLNDMGNDMISAVITLRPMRMTPEVLKRYGKWQKTNVQFIITKYETREELLEHFDLVHCKMNYHNGTIYTSPLVFDCISNKKLIHNKKDVQNWRIKKYQQKGYSYPKETLRV